MRHAQSACSPSSSFSGRAPRSRTVYTSRSRDEEASPLRSPPCCGAVACPRRLGGHSSRFPQSEGAHPMKRFAITAAALVLALSASSALAQPAGHGKGSAQKQRKVVESGQPVIDWNQTLLSIVNTPGAQPANIQPTRNFAILHAAIYDAVNSIDRTHEPYLISIRAPRDASKTAAADAAAHTALIGLYPAQQASLDLDYAAELAQVPNGPAKDKGIRVGEQVASDLLAVRANDGSNVIPAPFVAGTNPGDYRPTPPNLPTPVFTTWGEVTPFVLEQSDQFRPAPPPALTSDAYAAAINEVQSLGSANST